jgi:hypothetical protein
LLQNRRLIVLIIIMIIKAIKLYKNYVMKSTRKFSRIHTPNDASSSPQF